MAVNVKIKQEFLVAEITLTRSVMKRIVRSASDALPTKTESAPKR